MIMGIGTDIVEKHRIQDMAQKSDRFLDRFYSAEEQELIRGRKNPTACMAMNFAGKEAVVKAFGTGFTKNVIPQEISILRNQLGAPYVKLVGATALYAREHHLDNIYISLSDTKDEYAIAYVVIERKE